MGHRWTQIATDEFMGLSVFIGVNLWHGSLFMEAIIAWAEKLPFAQCKANEGPKWGFGPRQNPCKDSISLGTPPFLPVYKSENSLAGRAFFLPK